jgi:hypothetical protein
MSYVPAANEYAISAITAGFPATTAAYLRCYSNRLVPGVSAELTGQLLDANGNVLAGGTFSNTYDISSQTSFNAILKTLITSAASGYGITVN